MPNGDVIQGYPENSNLVTGVANRQILLLDSVGANDVGTWIDARPFSKGSLDLSCSGTMNANVSLLVSNAAQMPGNGFDINLTGSATPGDVVILLFQAAAFFDPGISVSYTVIVGDTLTTIAVALAALLNAALYNAGLHEVYGQTANTFASSFLATAVGPMVALVTQNPFPPNTLPMDLQATVSGAQTEIITITQYDSGLGWPVPGCTLTGIGFQAFTCPATWMKAAVTNWVSGTISLIAQLSLP